jgi:chromosome segregation ATPase
VLQALDDTSHRAYSSQASAVTAREDDVSTHAGERDDLKALLVATLKRLEAVDDVVRRADMANAVLEERVGVLEQERDEAARGREGALARVEELQQAQRRVEWQNKARAPEWGWLCVGARSAPCACADLL